MGMLWEDGISNAFVVDGLWSNGLPPFGHGHMFACLVCVQISKIFGSLTPPD